MKKAAGRFFREIPGYRLSDPFCRQRLIRIRFLKLSPHLDGFGRILSHQRGEFTGMSLRKVFRQCYLGNTLGNLGRRD